MPTTPPPRMLVAPSPCESSLAEQGARSLSAPGAGLLLSVWRDPWAFCCEGRMAPLTLGCMQFESLGVGALYGQHSPLPQLLKLPPLAPVLCAWVPSQLFQLETTGSGLVMVDRTSPDLALVSVSTSAYVGCSGVGTGSCVPPPRGSSVAVHACGDCHLGDLCEQCKVLEQLVNEVSGARGAMASNYPPAAFSLRTLRSRLV